MQRAIDKAAAMTDVEIMMVWRALRNYDPREEYSEGVSMDDWANIIYGERSKRGLPLT